MSEVHKRRRKAYVDWQGRNVEVSLDEVSGLGTFVELELVVDEKELDMARECIANLGRKIGSRAKRTAKLPVPAAGKIAVTHP